jgi:rhamnogalacturonyl hydrolase YesR
MIKHCFTLLFLLIISFANAQSAAKKAQSTRAIAELVLQKGLKMADLTNYQGSLLMHSMIELAVLEKEGKLLAQTIDLFDQYKTKKIKAKGSFLSYEAGGTGVAYLNYLKKTDKFSELVADYANKMFKKQKRSSEGILTAVWAADSLDLVFIDMVFAVTPFMLYSGLAENKPEYVDLAVFETLEMFKILRDNETGLLHQARGFKVKNQISEDNWSRGNGWGAFALASLIRDLPDTHPRKKEVNELAKNFFTAVIKHQNTEGSLWHQEMTDFTSFVETSGSGLLLYGLGIAIEKGVIDKSFTANFKKGLSRFLSYISADGSVSHATYSCLNPRRGTKMDYANHVWKYNDPHAFGPAVLAFTQAAKMGIDKIKPLESLGIYAISDTIQRKPQAYVRYMPEANQNICWENDRIAYRLYGSPVKDRVSSGIDVWTKSVEYPIVDKWYRLNEAGKEYHIDRGEGCDFFHVGFGRGNGGTAIWHNGKPYISQPYAYHRILKNTEEEIAFEIFYEAWTVDSFKVSERKVISMKMGTNFFKVVSTFDTEYKGTLTAAIGISYVDKPEILSDIKKGTLTIWESYLPQNGELGTTLITEPSDIKAFTTYKKEQFVLLNAKAGQPITYYVGAGWTKNPYFKTKQDWLDYVSMELKKMAF